MIEAKLVLTQSNDLSRQFVATTGSGHHLILDDTLGGTGAGPIELVAIALAGCAASDVMTYLRLKRHQKVTGYELRVEADQAETNPRVFTAIRMHHVITGRDINAEAVRAAIRLCNAAHGAIEAMLRHTVSVVATFEITPEKTVAGAA
ncbi:MAG TPA: OsmC family protein [Terriglobia bacterium]|nr:OsmC family protein [Terriglobia bacterium]